MSGKKDSHTENLNFGRAHKSGYGHSKIVLELKGINYSANKASSEKKGFVIWCVSDILLRDNLLAFSTVVDDICRELGLEGCRPNSEKSGIRVRRTESWQAKWGLPRPSLVTVQAGSCLWFDDISIPDNLYNKQASGIGERRGEGYGQFEVNPAVLVDGNKNWKGWFPGGKQAGNSATERILTGLEGAEKEFALQTEKIAWEAAIRDAVFLAVSDEGWRRENLGWVIMDDGGDVPGMSQLGTYAHYNGKFYRP